MLCCCLQESLQSEVVPDPMAAEQTWPSEQELREAEGKGGRGEGAEGEGGWGGCRG